MEDIKIKMDICMFLIVNIHHLGKINNRILIKSEKLQLLSIILY